MSETIDYDSQKIGEEKEEVTYQWEASEKEKEIIKHNRTLFRQAAENRGLSFENFDGLTLIEYI